MTRFILSRIVRTLLTIWLVVTITFVVLRVTGDPVHSLLPVETTPPEVIETYRALWGLDRPLVVQYVSFWKGLFSGTLGRSFADGRDAVGIIAERVPNTLVLVGWTLLATILIGVPLGALAAMHRGRALDRAVMALAVSGHSLPEYLIGILLIWLFAVELRWLPSSGHGTWAHLVLPVATLTGYFGAQFARFTRSAVLEVLGQPYVLAAHAQGWPGRAVMMRDVLPNAAIPLVTLFGFTLCRLIAGSIIVEWIYAWPGIGRLLITAVTHRDLAIVQALVMVFAGAMVLANLLVDISYVLLNPKLRVIRR